MTGQPRAKRDDRTSLLIGVGMAALLVIGVASVFGDGIAAAFAPPAASPDITGAAEKTAATPAPSGPAASDGGGSKS